MNKARERLKQIVVERSILRGRFKLASGRESDYYIDARLTTLSAEGARLIAEIFLEEIATCPEIVAVGGPTLGADPIVGAILALSFDKGRPLCGFLVRKEEKAHGTGRLIEGNLRPGDACAIVEDVATTGGSILRAIEAARTHGARVKKVMTVVDRGEGAEGLIKAAGCEFYSIFKVTELL
jgi:orotate phosphoribosyltransferase